MKKMKIEKKKWMGIGILLVGVLISAFSILYLDKASLEKCVKEKEKTYTDLGFSLSDAAGRIDISLKPNLSREELITFLSKQNFTFLESHTQITPIEDPELLNGLKNGTRYWYEYTINASALSTNERDLDLFYEYMIREGRSISLFWRGGPLDDITFLIPASIPEKKVREFLINNPVRYLDTSKLVPTPFYHNIIVTAPNGSEARMACKYERFREVKSAFPYYRFVGSADSSMSQLIETNNLEFGFQGYGLIRENNSYSLIVRDYGTYVDKEGDTHTVRSEYFPYSGKKELKADIFYNKQHLKSWSTPLVITHNFDYNVDMPHLWADSKNNAHIIWYGREGGADSGIYYIGQKDSNWGQIETLLQVGESTWTFAIGTNKNDDLVIWAPNGKIWQKTKEDAAPVLLSIEYAGPEYEKAIIKDAKSGGIHLVWKNSDGHTIDFLKHAIIKNSKLIIDNSTMASFSSDDVKTFCCILLQEDIENIVLVYKKWDNKRWAPLKPQIVDGKQVYSSVSGEFSSENGVVQTAYYDTYFVYRIWHEGKWSNERKINKIYKFNITTPPSLIINQTFFDTNNTVIRPTAPTTQNKKYAIKQVPDFTSDTSGTYANDN